MENETAVAEKTRREKIEEWESELAQHMARIEEFKIHEKNLLLQLKAGERLDAIKVGEVYDAAGKDLSPKGVADKVYHIPLRSDVQLEANIKKVREAIKHGTEMARRVNDKIHALRNEEFNELADEATQEVYRKYFEWLDGYKHVRDLYWNELVPTIQKAWEIDRKFPERGRKFGVNANAIISVMSHFRQGEFVSMEATIDKILYMADIEKVGKPLIEKHDSGGLPEVAEGPFFQESEFHN